MTLAGGVAALGFVTVLIVRPGRQSHLPSLAWKIKKMFYFSMHCGDTGVMKADFGKHGTARKIARRKFFEA